MSSVLFTAARQDDQAIVVTLNKFNQTESIVLPIVAWQMIFTSTEGYKARPVLPVSLSTKFSRIGVLSPHGIITETHIYRDRGTFEAEAAVSLRLGEYDVCPN